MGQSERTRDAEAGERVRGSFADAGAKAAASKLQKELAAVERYNKERGAR